VYKYVCFSTGHIVLNVTVPGQVVGLTPVASAHNVTVEWKKPSYNGECVTRYDISWRRTGSGQTGSNTTTEKEDSFTIESLDACVEYDISVSAVNRKDESNATTVSVTTETDGKYHVLFILPYLYLTDVYEMKA
jgi:hypothetical protein